MSRITNPAGNPTEEAAFQTRPFELFYKALTDRDVTIEEFPPEEKASFPDTPTTIRLPRTTAAMPKRRFFRLALAHRALHLQMGTFAFAISRVADPRMRAVLAPSDEGASDLEVFFSTFADVSLAQLLFEILEDARMDACLPLAYPGLYNSLREAVEFEMGSRPGWQLLPPRAAAVELALRLSLDPRTRQAPTAISEVGKDVIAIFDSLNLVEASVEEVALATVRLYGVVSLLPNLGIIDGLLVQSLGREAGHQRLSAIWPRNWPEGGRVRLEGDDILQLSLPGVSYRGSIGAFIIKAPTASGPDHQALYRIRTSAQSDRDAEAVVAKSTVTGPPEPLPHDHHDVSRHLHRHEEGELRSLGSSTFLYPEWDLYLGRYRPNWCRVVQRRSAASGALERSSLQIRYANELRRLRRTMDITPSQAFVVERRTASGCDVDYDAAVEALVDIRAGGGIDDSVYLDLRRKRRDISVLLLVDVSASTAERVEDAEPIELALSPEALPQHKLRPPRILDIEVISSLLCTSALNSVGDAFSIWSFSGTGREQVVLSEIKGFNEPMSGVVVSRAAGMKPMHATRLGAAVRHCGMVLSKLQSETKVLLVLTDGRPFDIDYGTSYGEGESQPYALADSDKALFELTERGIEPYVLTVDPSSEEYVSELKSVKVEILEDVKALPEKLLRLYKGLLDRNAKTVARRSHGYGPSKVISQTSGGITR